LRCKELFERLWWLRQRLMPDTYFRIMPTRKARMDFSLSMTWLTGGGAAATAARTGDHFSSTTQTAIGSTAPAAAPAGSCLTAI